MDHLHVRITNALYSKSKKDALAAENADGQEEEEEEEGEAISVCSFILHD